MSIKIRESVALAPFVTMRAGGIARFFVNATTPAEVEEAVTWARTRSVPIFILGGGSNVLVPDLGFPGIVIKIQIKGIAYEDRSTLSVCVIAGAGEMWDDLVGDTVAHNLWGIENLSLIPGTVGGAVVQNIGAYGVEVCECIEWVEALDMLTMEIKRFSHDECAFGYRESIFKKNKQLVVIRLALDLIHKETRRTSYEDIKKYFTEKNIEVPTLLEMREAVVAIRTTKMPAPPLGTAGSFFKNPVVSKEQFEDLKKRFPEIKAYIQGDKRVKLSAAWLLDHVVNVRGMRIGDAGVHERQALIIVNYGNAPTEDILALAEKMKRAVKEKTNILLEEEVVMMCA